MIKLVKGNFKYFGPARLFGGRSPPKRRVGLSAKSFLMRRKGALKKDIASNP